jgi:hypothetical protein
LQHAEAERRIADRAGDVDIVPGDGAAAADRRTRGDRAERGERPPRRAMPNSAWSAASPAAKPASQSSPSVVGSASVMT